MSIFAQGAFQIDPNSTPEQIRRKREAIAKLMPQFGKARYVGEGIGQLAYGIGSGMQERALDKQEAAGTAAAGDIYSGILSRVSSRAPSGGSTYSAAPAPRPTSESQVLADDVMSALGKDAASQFGGIESQYSLPPGYLDRTYEVESGRNPNARNPNSSAGGGFQFIDSTARAYGLTDKTDLGASADAAARLARDNSAQLRAVLGREPTAAELYLAHQQGGAGAAKLLSNPNARAVDIVGFDAVRLNGGDANMTAGEFASKWTGKFGSGSSPVMSAQNAPTQAGGIPMADLYAAMANPWMSAEQRAVIGSMIQQQEQAADPLRRMQMEKAQLELAQMRDGKGDTEYGLNPQYGVDANGNPVLIQIGKDGGAVQTKLPNGVTLSKEPIRLDAGTHYVLLDPITRQPIGNIPKDLRGAESEKSIGSIEGTNSANAAAELGGIITTAEGTISLIDAVMNDPALDSITGMIQGNLPPMSQAGVDLNIKLDQLKGKAFLEAFESLKGGGSITETEGKVATAAMARLDRAQSSEEYRKALKELRDVLETGMARARAKVGGMTAPAPGAAGAPAGDIPTFNPQTGAWE
jgi:hypothetical protein